MWIYPELLPDALVATDDGGYLLAGRESAEVFSPAVLVKTDADGEVEWREFYGAIGLGVDELIWTTDGGYALVGSGGEEGEAASIVRADGGYVFLGDTRSPPTASGDSDLWLVGVDSDGAERWTRTYGDLDGVGGHSGTLVAVDAGYAFTGSIDGAFGLGRVDADGREAWIRTLPLVERAEFPTELLATSDGGYLVAGLTGVPSGAFNARLVKLR